MMGKRNRKRVIQILCAAGLLCLIMVLLRTVGRPWYVRRQIEKADSISAGAGVGPPEVRTEDRELISRILDCLNVRSWETTPRDSFPFSTRLPQMVMVVNDRYGIDLYEDTHEEEPQGLCYAMVYLRPSRVIVGTYRMELACYQAFVEYLYDINGIPMID